MRAKLLLIYILISLWTLVWCSKKISPLEDVWDPKHFKQLLRTRKNVLVLFLKNTSVFEAFKKAAEEVRGYGTMLTVDCSAKAQKLCRQLKAAPDPHLIHHYKDGKFHKVYDRKETTKSIVRFMQDPTGDVPWEEDPDGKDVVHIENQKEFEKLLKKHKTALVMFYAPWCVYCKQMKPEYAAAATVVRSNNLGVLAAVDLVLPENLPLRVKYNISAFPTVYLFKNGDFSGTYEGESKHNNIVEFMKNPKAAPLKVEEVPWSEEESEVHHLTTINFDQIIKENPSTLVMFYAPWCGHCKKLKPEWVKAAAIVQSEQLPGIIAAVDATKERSLSQQFQVGGYPTIKYFRDGEFAFDTPNLRDSKKIIDFIRDPKEPPPPPPPEPDWSDLPSEVVHLNEDNFMNQLRSKRHALVMFYAPWCGHCKSAKPEFEAAAEVLKEETRMVMAAVNCVENAELCKSQKVSGYPTFKYFNYFKVSSMYDGGRKMADFVNFFEGLEPGFVQKSQSNDISSTSQPPSTLEHEKTLSDDTIKKKNEEVEQFWKKMIHITDKNFHTVSSKYDRVLITFHSNACESCKELKHVLAQLVQNLDQSLGVLAACDVEEAPNLVSSFKVNSLPALKYFIGGQFISDYSGENTFIGLKKFLKDMRAVKDEL